MASIVTEALNSAGSLAKDNWNTKITKLSRRALDIKRELSNSIEHNYSDLFLPLLSSSEQVSSKLTKLRNDVNILQRSFDTMIKNQIEDSTKDFERLSTEHAKTSKLVEMLEKLDAVHSFFLDESMKLKSKNYYQAAVALLKISEILDDLEGNLLVETAIYKALRVEFIVEKEKLQYELDEQWRDHITWSLPTEYDDEVVKTKLTIDFADEHDGMLLQNIIYGLHACGDLMFKMQRLSRLFMQHFIKPSIIEKSSYPSVKASQHSLVMEQNEVDQDEQYSSPNIVFEKLKTCLEFLNDHLLKTHLQPAEEHDERLMSIFRRLVCEELVTLLIENCLVKSVPKSKEDLQSYEKVEASVKNFERLLKSVGFFSGDSAREGDLVAFVSDVNVHFANQRCTAILAKARSYMKMDIHDTVQVEGEKFGQSPNLLDKLKSHLGAGERSTSLDAMLESVSTMLHPSRPMDEMTMCLPRFRISRGAKEVVDLAYDVLCEATNSTADCASRLVATTQNIFELYTAVVPTYHRESLIELPQVAAIHYNDCWFISHHLLTIGHQFTKLLPIRGDGVELTFVHQVPVIRKLGSECFLLQMRRQRDTMLECLAPLKSFSSQPSSDKYATAERPIKQVLHQLQHLRKVWSGILPSNQLTTSLATLVDSVVSEVVSCICVMQDISSDDSTQLSEICSFLQDRIPALFQNEEDVQSPWQREVKKWQRLLELTRVLEASLRDIVDRWADGKGPLASCFTAVEVKGLIRALFQNTDRRSTAISKIRY